MTAKEERRERSRARGRVILRLYREAMDNPAEEKPEPFSPLFDKLIGALGERRRLEEECRKILRGRRWESAPLLARLVLLSGAAELLLLQEGVESKGRIISAYVNIARRYLEPPQVKFVNAALDKLANR